MTTLDFVKGHCGWDVVTLVPEGQIPAEEELAASVKIMSMPIDGGLEVGWLGRGDAPGEIRLRMVNSTTRNWISMCGGMTQVIGKALVETSLGDRFGVDGTQPTVNVTLLTPSGPIPVRVETRDGVATVVTTVMDGYLAHSYGMGIEPLTLHGVDVLRVGKYLVLDVAELERVHPGIDFTRRDPGPHLDIVNEILRAYRDLLGEAGVNGMMFDDRPEGPGGFRVFPRFYSDDLSAARIPWEFQCGTGGIVVAMTLAHTGRLPFAGRSGEVLLEWGSHRTTPDPYGIRTSLLTLERDGDRLVHAAFSHSTIEVLADGTLTIPSYA